MISDKWRHMVRSYCVPLLVKKKKKNTAKITAPHMLALRQIAWLNQTGSRSNAFQLITASSGLVRELTTCYISIAQRETRERQSSAVAEPERVMKDEVQGLWKGCKGASSFVFQTRRSSPTCLPSLPAGEPKLIHSSLKETPQITPITEHLAGTKKGYWDNAYLHVSRTHTQKNMLKPKNGWLVGC